MIPSAVCRLLAVMAVAVPIAAGAAYGQSSPGAVQREPAPPPAPQRFMSPGYNPGEILRDLANPVVAEVDGRPITLSEVGDAIRALPANLREIPFDELYPGVLERLIQQQALVAKARRMGIDTDPVVRRQMQTASDRVLENALLNRLLDSQVSEQALLARYQKEYADKAGPEEVQVRVIMLASEAQARKDIAEVAAGADFAALAKRDSVDASAGQGGDLGFLRQDKLIPEIGAVAFALEPGQVSPNPVRAGRNWFVIKVDARRRVAQPGFAEVREQLRQQIMQENLKSVADDAISEAAVRRFNVNGTDASPAEDRDKSQSRPRP